MLVRLTKKLAEMVDGIDISHCDEGDVIDLPAAQGRVLIAEGWGEPASAPGGRAVAADRGARRRGPKTSNGHDPEKAA